MNRTILALGFASLFGASLLGAEENKNGITADRISLFTVPLRCPAAPDIGCGTQSKPILLELQREPTIAETWLNGTGTVLAVVWTSTSSHEPRTKPPQPALEQTRITAAT